MILLAASLLLSGSLLVACAGTSSEGGVIIYDREEKVTLQTCYDVQIDEDLVGCLNDSYKIIGVYRLSDRIIVRS